jgi:hypothetical protein
MAVQALTITPAEVNKVSMVLYRSERGRGVSIKIGNIDPVIDLLCLSHTVLPGNTHGSYFLGPHASA